MWIHPSTVLLGLLCPWTWGISSKSLQCLPSCWASLTLDMGYLLKATPALHSHGKQYWPACSCILAWRNLPLDREAWQATVSRVTKSRTLPKQPHVQRRKTFFAWQLCPSESWPWWWHSCLACRDSGSTKCAGTWTASTTGVMALSESFFEPLVAGDQKASLASLSP